MRVVKRIDFGNPTFQKTFSRLKPDIAKEARRLISELILVDLDNAPAKLHFHNLKSKTAPSVFDKSKQVPVYTIHITSNDVYKASFTYEENCVFLRVCGEHDEIDDRP